MGHSSRGLRDPKATGFALPKPGTTPEISALPCTCAPQRCGLWRCPARLHTRPRKVRRMSLKALCDQNRPGRLSYAVACSLNSKPSTLDCRSSSMRRSQILHEKLRHPIHQENSRRRIGHAMPATGKRHDFDVLSVAISSSSSAACWSSARCRRPGHGRSAACLSDCRRF